MSHLSPYRECLGTTFDEMPQTLQRFHAAPNDFVAHGEVEVIAGTHLLARLVVALMHAPTQSMQGPFTLSRSLHADLAEERWDRRFPEHRFRSRLCAHQGLLVESMGPFSASSRVIWQAPFLRLELVAVRIFGIPVPRALLPTLIAEETADGNRLQFNIDTRAPLVGRLFAYRGYLEVPA